MKRQYVWFALISAMLLGAMGVCEADVLQAAPQDVALLPDDGSGVTRIVFLFDLSKLRTGDNRRIEEALLDWRVNGLSSDELSEFSAYKVQTTWTSTAVKSGTAPTFEGQSTADWQVKSTVPETADGKLVRLDLTKLVDRWASGVEPNYGTIVATSALPSKLLASQIGKAQLTIRYGFRRF